MQRGQDRNPSTECSDTEGEAVMTLKRSRSKYSPDEPPPLVLSAGPWEPSQHPGMVLYHGRLPDVAQGGIVCSVTPDSQAWNCGFRSGDVIISIETATGFVHVTESKCAERLLLTSRARVKCNVSRSRRVLQAMAATKIQATVMGHTVRLLLTSILGPEQGRRWQRSALIIQTAFRRFDAQLYLLGSRMAMTYIQAAARGYIQRSRPILETSSLTPRTPPMLRYNSSNLCFYND
eukprot:2707923-Pleurochrysis_carterae.AAC.2